MTLNVHAYTLRPSFRAALLGFLVHHNPFYLLSALSMLAGCYALNSGLAARTGDLPKLLALLGVLNAYEAILIGLGLYLIRRRGIVRDGRTLLLLQAAFLVDLAFLDAEVGSVSVRTGCLLDVLVLTLALLKAGVVVRALWGRVPRQLFAFVALQLGVLFLLPSVFTQFRQHQNGNVTPGQFYGAWWVVGALMILYELQARFLRHEAAFDTGLRLFIRRLYVALPLTSIVLHLSLLHWVYRVPFVAGDLSPLLIGAAFVLGRSAHASRGDIRLIRMLMPLAAVILSAEHAPAWRLPLAARFDLTPTLLVMGMAYVTIVYCFFFARALRLLVGAVAVALLVLFGPTLDQIVAGVVWTWERGMVAFRWLADRSAIEWGLTAMGAAFAFLALGAGISLRKEPVTEPVAASE
ncbi:MAG TPA: hypothetical protein VGI81_25280 [Tepidisphaeraceae bacterium]